MINNVQRLLVAFVAIMVCLLMRTPAEGAEVPAACRVKIDARVPGWRLKLPSAEVAAWAKEERIDPTLLQVDLDDDGVRDIAVLVVTGTGGGERSQIAVCMARKAGPELHVISDPYCTDGIFIRNKGSRGFDFETDKEITYRTNGVHAFCFEKAGATYLYRGGRFIRIIDSD